MDGSLARCLMVFFICCAASVFYIKSCVTEKQALLTPEERSVLQLQDAFEECLLKMSRKEEKTCLSYIESLKKSIPLLSEKPQPVARTTPP